MVYSPTPVIIPSPTFQAIGHGGNLITLGSANRPCQFWIGDEYQFINPFFAGLPPLELNYIRIRAHCSFIGRCLRYFIRPDVISNAMPRALTTTIVNNISVNDINKVVSERFQNYKLLFVDKD
ncbi:hypothetical protein T06_8050 [Trichinella sp. T6]|nr:hypothetical protein T06_8050 [Trichinella sp. T6]